MRRSLFTVLLFLACASFARTASAQGISTLVVNAPRAILTAGESMRLRAGARDNQGNRVAGGVYQWSSSNSSVATVDSAGVVTASGIGITNITVRSGSVQSPNLALQVLPLRIDVTSNAQEVLVGQKIQFSATLVDINGQPVANPTILWSVTGPNGNASRAASIDSQGVLTATGASLVTVHAAVTFTGQSSAQLSRFENVAHVEIKAPVDYKLTRWLATDTLDRTFTIRPSYMSEISVNDAGQVAVVANLGGLSSALLLYQNGNFDILASTGQPGSRPTTYIYQFEAPASINNTGQVVVRYSGQGESGLLLASTLGVALLPEGFSLGNLQRLGFFRIGRSSLNDRGDIVFLASFNFEGSRTQNTGLFRATNGNVVLLWSNSDSLPGSPPGYSFDSRDFGQDNAGNVYFTAVAGSTRTIYKITETAGVEKLAGAGTVVAGSFIQSINRWVLSPDGAFAFTGVLQSGNQAVIRLMPRNSRSEILPVVNTGNLLGVASSGEVFWYGDPGAVGEQRGWGLWRWPTSGLSEQVMPWGASIGGGSFGGPRSGAITSKGELFAEISTTTSDLLVVRPQQGGTVLFREGTPITAKVALNLQGIVPGASEGPVHVFTGSANAAIMQAGPNELKPVWVPGDRPTGLTSSTASFAAKDSAGTLYLAVGNGIMRLRAGQTETLLSYPIRFPIQQGGESITITWNTAWYIGSLAFAANRSGSFVWSASDGTYNRLMFYDRGQVTSLMAQGGPTQTVSPGGGVFSGIANGHFHQNSVAIDEKGRIFVNGNVAGGPSGLFLYENGRWNVAALFGNTRVAGETVTGAVAIHSGEDRFYALLDLSGGRALAEYDGQQWKVLVARTDVTPDGIDIGSFSNLLSVNRRGGVAFLATGTRGRIVTRTPDGKLHVVYSGLDKTGSGDMLWPTSYMSLQYHDDGRLYLVGLDTLDRNTLHVAEPLF